MKIFVVVVGLFFFDRDRVLVFEVVSWYNEVMEMVVWLG